MKRLWQHVHRKKLDRTVCATDVMRHKNYKSTNQQLSQLLTLGAAILDFEVRVGEIPPSFQVRNPTGVPVKISKWDVRNSDFPVQMKQTNSPANDTTKQQLDVFYTLVFVKIKQTRCHIQISEP